MLRCVSTVAATLHEGKDSGDFEIEDPDYLANLLWPRRSAGCTSCGSGSACASRKPARSSSSRSTRNG